MLRDVSVEMSLVTCGEAAGMALAVVVAAGERDWPLAALVLLHPPLAAASLAWQLAGCRCARARWDRRWHSCDARELVSEHHGEKVPYCTVQSSEELFVTEESCMHACVSAPPAAVPTVLERSCPRGPMLDGNSRTRFCRWG